MCIAVSLILCSGCSNKELSRSRAKSIIESHDFVLPKNPYDPVIVSNEAFTCAVSAGLLVKVPMQPRWDPTEKGVALRIHALGRNGEVRYQKDNYLRLDQARLVVHEVTGITGTGDTRLISARVSAKVAHPCFPEPMPFAGAAGAYVFAFRLYDDGWRVSGIQGIQ